MGKIFPPLVDLSSIPEDGKRLVQALHIVLDLVKVLADNLGPCHWDLTTKPIAMMMIGWSKGKSRINHYYDR